MSNTHRARCVFMVSFDADLGLLGLDPEASDREKSLSSGRYGATRGLRRVLQVLADHDAPATWYVPTRNLERYPEHAELIGSATHELGHEIACVGEDLNDLMGLPLAEQVSIFATAADRLATRYGEAPAGYRVAHGEPHPDLAAALHERGFRWSSNLRGDDLPYRHPGGLIEIPRHHELDDTSYFSFNLDPAVPAGSPRIAPIGTVLHNWITEFDAYRDEGLCFTLDLHTELIGTPARCEMLGTLLTHIRATGDVEMCTAGTVADWWSTREPAAKRLFPDHPLSIFTDGRRRAQHTNTQ